MISLPSGTRIWLVAGVTDMRKSFNGLGEQIQHVLDDNPFSGHLFIFRGRRGDTIKILWADADGLCLFTKRLEEGQFIWPAVHDGKIPHISRKRTTPGCTRCHTRPVTSVNQNGFILPVPVICYVPMRGHTRFCGLSAWGCQKRSVVWSSHSSGVMVSVSFIWMPVPDICRVYPLSTGNPEIHNMKSLTTETALDILITWLQDNIDCESGIIFDNDEDKTGSAALLRCIEQAREGIRTLRQQ